MLDLGTIGYMNVGDIVVGTLAVIVTAIALVRWSRKVGRGGEAAREFEEWRNGGREDVRGRR